VPGVSLRRIFWLPFAAEVNPHVAVPSDILGEVPIEVDASLVGRRDRISVKDRLSFMGFDPVLMFKVLVVELFGASVNRQKRQFLQD
jgi:hypothetical protein